MHDFKAYSEEIQAKRTFQSKLRSSQSTFEVEASRLWYQTEAWFKKSISLNVTALDEHYRALLFVQGLTDGLRAGAMREHPRTLREAIRAARTARRNAVLTRPWGSVGSSRNR